MKSAAQEYATLMNPNRQLLPVGYIQHMRLKMISPDELYELKQHMDYNPTWCYEDYPHPEDVGHDQCYRYQLKGEAE